MAEQHCLVSRAVIGLLLQIEFVVFLKGFFIATQTNMRSHLKGQINQLYFIIALF